MLAQARARLVWPLLAALVLLTRLSHLNIVWVEEGYPIAAAIQMLAGKALYKDFWFDKPPLFPAAYMLWGASTGVMMRVAGAAFVMLAAWQLYRFAKALWGEREGLLAAALLVFSLTFWIPSAVMVLGPDLLMIVPHIVAVHFAWKKQALFSGLACGIALGFNVKALFVVALCGVLLLPELLLFGLGLLASSSIWIGYLAVTGALPGYWQQVWAWGFLYSAKTFGAAEGLARTASWAGFHAALVVGTAVALYKERNWRLGLWFAVSFVAVCAGWRFFPRYYFHLLPAAALLGARGLMLIPVGWLRLATFALLLIPAVRFGPRYASLASELGSNREHDWRDLAMSSDTRHAAAIIKSKTGDTLLVWGYRPDLFALTRLEAGSPFLDSQPLTGVIADRHLTSSESAAPELAAANRVRLKATRPTWIADGLGKYNPQLAITNFADLSEWLKGYKQAGETEGFVIWRRID